jgi:tetratricopeptide (TPR) repeat protein
MLNIPFFNYRNCRHMKGIVRSVIAVSLFIAGIGVGAAAQKGLSSSMYRDATPGQAGRTLLDAAQSQAGKGTWERIAVGRVHYLAGHKAEAQAIFDALLNGRHDDSDVLRIARVYAEAGEWAKAEPLYQRYLDANPEDETELAEAGAHYLLNGDRDTAERLFDRSFGIETEFWATLSAAGAYLGVAPQQ